MEIVEEYRARPREGKADIEARRAYVSGGGVWTMSRRASGWGVYRSGIWHRAGNTVQEARGRVLSFAADPVGSVAGKTKETREEPIESLSFSGEEWL